MLSNKLKFFQPLFLLFSGILIFILPLFAVYLVLNLSLISGQHYINSFALKLLILSLCFYVSGSIPYGYIFGRLAGLGDIRAQGSGNIGATNALRLGNKFVALFTLLFDFFKSYIPIIFLLKYHGFDQAIAINSEAINWIVCYLSFLTLLGHIYPIWLNFKGGKGVATGLGIYFAISPLLGILTVFIWGITAKFFKISSLSALAAFLGSLIFYYPLMKFSIGINFGNGTVHQNSLLIFYSYIATITLVIFYTHRENIQRLRQNQESRVVNKSSVS